MAEISESSALDALSAAFSDQPTTKAVKAPVAPSEPVPEPSAEEAAPDADAPVEDGEEIEQEAGAEGDEEQEAPAEAEPEYQVEVGGKVEIVRGKEQVKELLQKGLDYTRKTEETARHAAILNAKMQSLALQERAQAEMYEDMTQLRALDSQLQQYNNVDWAAAFDADPFNAMKIKEQRDQLREARANKVAELQNKHSAIQKGQAEATQAALRAENEALLTKLPQWRNSEQATKEKSSLAKYLMDAGFGEGEVAGLMDHRALLITRKAWLYDQLQASKQDKVKQLRDAPTMAKPGAAPQQQKTNQKTAFAKFRQELKTQGRKGNSRAQEGLMLDVLNRTFK